MKVSTAIIVICMPPVCLDQSSLPINKHDLQSSMPSSYSRCIGLPNGFAQIGRPPFSRILPCRSEAILNPSTSTSFNGAFEPLSQFAVVHAVLTFKLYLTEAGPFRRLSTFTRLGVSCYSVAYTEFV